MSETMVEAQKERVVAAACAARANAYAPYSHYAVGAAVLTEDDQLFTGVNVENASYGLTNCAERTAVFKMVSEGGRRIVAAAVCTKNGGPPCGACRQVLSEFAGDIPIWLSDAQGNIRETTLYTLLPDHFTQNYLIR
jgi:cytidine deaminase